MAQGQLKVYRQALLKHAFEGKLTAQWREQYGMELHSGEELLAQLHNERTERFQAALKAWEEGGKIGRKPVAPNVTPEPSSSGLAGLPPVPKEWIWVNLQTVLETKPSNGRSVKDRKGGFPVLRLTALRGEKLNLTECKEGDWTQDEAESYLVREGDFFISRGNGSKHLVGLGCLAKDVTFSVAYPDTMIRLRPEKSCFDPRFLFLIWNSRLVRDQIERCARTTAGIYKINQEQIQNFKIPLLTKAEQLEIVSLLEARLSVIAAVENTINDGLAKAEALRQSILKKAFSGQLVPQDPNDEPASVLLERIKAEKAAQTQPKKRKAKEKVRA